MSKPLDPESSILEGLETLNIRDRVPMSRSVYLQIERCNSSISGPDPSIFEANVRALLTLLPTHKHKEVMDRTKEYNDTVESFVFQHYCNQQIGTTNNPKMSKDNSGNRHIVKRDQNDNIDWDDPNIVSPTLVERTDTDYEKLYRVIISSLESANITWKIQRKTVEMGKVIKSGVSEAVLNNIAQIVGYQISQYRKLDDYKHLTYNQVAGALKLATPSTPLYNKEGDLWPE